MGLKGKRAVCTYALRSVVWGRMYSPTTPFPSFPSGLSADRVSLPDNFLHE